MERVNKGEKYWYIELEAGRGFRTDFTYDTCLTDDKNYEIGNYFRTREESESMTRKLRAVLAGAEVIEKPMEKEIHFRPLMLEHSLTDVLDDGRY